MHQRSELSHGYSPDIYHGQRGPSGHYRSHDYGYDAGNFYPESHPAREESYEYGPRGEYGEAPYSFNDPELPDPETRDRQVLRRSRPPVYPYGNPFPGPHTGRGPKGYRRSDERMTEDVCERLTAHGGLDASEIEVRVKEGEVTLEGTVETRRQKHLAEALAKTVRGIQDVHNRLRLKKHRQPEEPAPEAETSH